jgi:(5-formylfuran-3-yl)methyl phosphate synthase
VRRRAVKLLVSVRSAEEATAALEGGADIIDAKEPARGSLGAADPETLPQIVRAVGGARPVSAAWGELIEEPVAWLPTGLSYAKVGLAGARQRPWQAMLVERYHGCQSRPIAVAYADHERADAPDVDAVLAWAEGFGVAGVLIDTWLKDGRRLFDFLGEPEVIDVIHRARRAGFLVALAGSLDGYTLKRAIALEPDIIAVRGAACRNRDRISSIDASRVRALAAAISAHNAQKVATAD